MVRGVLSRFDASLSKDRLRWRRAYFAAVAVGVLALPIVSSSGCANGTPANGILPSDDGGVSEVDGGDTTLPGDGPGDVPGDGGANGGSSGNGADASDTDTPGVGGGCTDKIVINEIMPAGANNAEFIELYNPNDCAVSVGKWKVLYRSKDDSADETKFTFSSSQKLASKAFFVIGTPTISGKDGSFTGGLGNSGGQLGLVDNGEKLIDAVGFGPAHGAYVEGTPTALAGTDESVGRVPDGLDTDDNASDLKLLAAPSPGASNN